MTRTARHLLALAALSFGCTLAQAESYVTYPGATCSSDGPAAALTNGALVSMSPQTTGYTTFTCPIVRRFDMAGQPSTLYVYLSVRLSHSLTDFLCVLRSVTYEGEIYDSDSHTFPTRGASSNTQGTGGYSLTVSKPPTDTAYTANLRCRVPNYLGSQAGILSYHVRESL